MKVHTIFCAVLLGLSSKAFAQNDTRTACDFQDIKAFVQWFKGSATRQKSATADPLDAAFDEYDDKGKKLPLEYEPHAHEELGWPILPYLGNDWLETYTERDADTVEYNTAGGMAYNHTYVFQRQPCWKLVKFTHDRLDPEALQRKRD